jgi:hypothetical protein
MAETAYLEEQLPAGKGGAEPGHLPRTGATHTVAGYAVGYDERVHRPIPHDMLHIPGYGRDLRAEVEASPVDAIEAHHVVGVPENDRFVAQAFRPEAIGDLAGGVGRVPFLGQDGSDAALSRGRPDQV